jgi:hypothetical protein
VLLGNFLLQNYKQSLQCIRDLSHELSVYRQATGFTEQDFRQWLKEESDFLSIATKKEPLLQTLKVSYAVALDKLYGYE